MANVPIFFDQGGAKLTVGAGGTLDTTNGTVTLGPVAVGPDGIDTANLQDGCVTTDKILDANVTTAKMALLSVDDTILADDAVITDKILDENVTKAKINMYLSPTMTGDGMDEPLMHGLGVNPTTANVFIGVMDTLTNTVGDFNAAIVSTSDTLVTVNVTPGVLYRVMAIAP